MEKDQTQREEEVREREESDGRHTHALYAQHLGTQLCGPLLLLSGCDAQDGWRQASQRFVKANEHVHVAYSAAIPPESKSACIGPSSSKRLGH